MSPLPVVAAVVLAGLGFAGQPTPGPPPGAPVHHHLVVRGRLKAGTTLTVVAYRSYDLPNAPGFTAEVPTTLCYQHGTSRRACTFNQSSMWSVEVLSGKDQFLTLLIAGKVVARVAYRDADVAGPPARAEAPRALTEPTPSSRPDEPVPKTARGGLSGPATLRVGEQAYFWGPLGPGALCYRHGTSRTHCEHSMRDAFYVTIAPGRDQYFTLRIGGKVVSRLVYRGVTSG